MTRGLDAREAVRRLLVVAQAGEAQSPVVADFLLAWWDADECGGFDFGGLCEVESPVLSDMLSVQEFIATSGVFPDELELASEFQELATTWRPAARERVPERRAGAELLIW